VKTLIASEGTKGQIITHLGGGKREENKGAASAKGEEGEKKELGN
jgi:hypothetical protein